MRVALIGPAYPFRGGIAHHTTLLARALRRCHQVRFISFSRQYPAWLYPGRTDRDPSRAPVRPDGVERLLDPLNPLSWHAAARAAASFGAELLILPWWTAFWAPQSLYVATRVRAACGARLAVLCHNVAEHEPRWWKRMACRALLRRADRIVVHSEANARRARELVDGSVPVFACPHPSLRGLGLRGHDRADARRRLGLSKPVVLFFGFVREYKGVDVLLDAMARVVRQREATLVVAGEFWEDRGRYERRVHELGLAGRVRLDDRYIPNEEVGLYFAAADLVVQPYLSASASGVTRLALDFGRPVIATRVGALPEVVQDGENGRLVPPGDAAALADAIVRSFEPAELARLSRNAAPEDDDSWAALVRALCANRDR
ncbi:MAG: glycosyltransferase [Candidatus Brocadiia bacterium]